MDSHKLVFLASLLVSFLLSSGHVEADMYNSSSSNKVSVHGDGATPSYRSSGALLIRSRSLEYSQNLFSVDNHGAHGDGSHDDTKALQKAWDAACSSARPAVVLIPSGRSYLVKPITLSGPCKSSVVFMVKGTVVASPSRSDWSEETMRHWVMFSGVDGLSVTGGGTVDGNGNIWWLNSCKINPALSCTEAPTALTFYSCTNLRVENLRVVDSQQIHVSVEGCTNVRMAHLSITAPGTSPNTDGIHVTGSKNVQVANCMIKTGDDCMSIETGTQNLQATNIVCGPGHGISIGSLGDGNSEAQVSGITIDNVQLHGTTNGARIKTWQGGSGYAKDITFQNMIMDNVQNPIIIDQNYCDSPNPCKTQGSAVAVSSVLFKNIRGTSALENAITLNCSSSIPCHGIVLQDVKLTMKGGGGGSARSTCRNVEWSKSGTVLPQPCAAKN